jgi:septum formation protein
MNPFPSVYLASQSPRRQALLRQMGVAFDVVAAKTREDRLAGETAWDMVARLAMRKAKAGLSSIRESGAAPRPVLGADTCVVSDDDVLGKPSTVREARAMLSALSGKAHVVYTAIALVDEKGFSEMDTVETRVWFAALSDADIRWYCETGEPFDKAGGYAIQGAAALFVRRLKGSYSGVVGLPIYETGRLLRRCCGRGA